MHASHSHHNLSNNASSNNNDVAFNDSAYRTGLMNNSNMTSQGGLTTHHLAPQNANSNEMTYFLFKSLRLRRSTLTLLVTGFLMLSLLMERFCFLVTVYKTKYYGYVLILIVIALNCIFNFALTRMRKKKQKKRLHELLNIERTPNVGWCVIGIIG